MLKPSLRRTLVAAEIVLGILLVAAAATFAAFNAQRFVAMPTADPGTHPGRAEKLRAVSEALRRKKDHDALLVVQDGAIIEESYGTPVLTPILRLREQSSASLAKGAIGGTSMALLSCAGILDLDAPGSAYIPEWQDRPDRAAITVRQLATHSSGLADANRLVNEPWVRTFRTQPERRLKIALDVAAIRPPGEAVSYSNPGYTLLSYVLATALKRAGVDDLRDILRDRIMRPLGIPDGAWDIGYGKPYHHAGLLIRELGGGAYFTARGMARLGELFVGHGSWRGRQILDPTCIDRTLVPAQAPPHPLIPTQQPPAAGLGWWLNSNGAWANLPRDTMIAAGVNHQNLVVIPSLRLVIVRFGGGMLGQDAFDGDYWTALVEQIITPVVEAASTTG